jgi:hypothetical protein
MRLHLLALTVALLVSAPPVARERVEVVLGHVPLSRTSIAVTEASRSTALLPFELSAVRLRPEPRNPISC